MEAGAAGWCDSTDDESMPYAEWVARKAQKIAQESYGST